MKHCVVVQSIEARGGFAAAAEWASLTLADFPSNRTAALKFAQREGWQELGPSQARKRQGRGGGWEYHVSCLPKAAQRDYERRLAAFRSETALQARQKEDRQAVASKPEEAIDARRRMIMEARAAVVIELERRAILLGGNFSKAVAEFLAEAKTGLLPEAVAQSVKTSVEKSRGKPPSRPTLYNWRRAYLDGGVMALLPEKRAQETKQAIPEWFPGFLRHFACPGKPTIAHALENYAKELGSPEDAPSYPQVRRVLKALQGTEQHLMAHKGREGPLALKARLMFKRRTLEGMEPTIVYTADGKTFDAEIAHPLHGRPFKPEITTVIDVVTRKIVGWSVDLAENSRAVTDALRYACMHYGVPAIFYTDRGPGYKNATIEGLCARLGITATHSLPYNSQARGAIERVNGSVWNKAAKEFVTYLGKDMDREAAQRVHKRTRRDLKEFGASKLLPSFAEFIETVEARVAAYNNAAHDSLRVRDPQTGRMRKGSPNEAWAQFDESGFDHFPVSPEEADELFRPVVKRRCRRGEVEWIGNQYMHEALEPYHGLDVMVGYDIHDASRVWVREIDQVNGEAQPGRLICVADFWNNKTRYVPVTFEEHAREQRVKGQLRRLEDKQERALADIRAPLVLDAPNEVPLPPVQARQEVQQPSASVVELQPVEAQRPRRDPRNPMNDPDIALAWDILDRPVGSHIPPHHVALLWDVLGNLAAVEMMKDVQLPIAELIARLEAAAEPLKSSIGG